MYGPSLSPSCYLRPSAFLTTTPRWLQRSLGLTGRQKLAQLFIAVCVWAVLLFRLPFRQGLLLECQHSILKITAEPGGVSYVGPYIYLLLIVVVLLGFSNGVNLTDGLDGLAISVTFIAMTALTALTYLSSDAPMGQALNLHTGLKPRS